MRFAVKHAVATGIVVTGVAAFTAALYCALFAAAVIFDQPLGSPVAGPFAVLFAVIATTVSIAVVLLPVTAFTEWICQTRGIRVWWQIPIATALLGLWLLVVGVTIGVGRGTPLASTAGPVGIAFLLLLAPLGLYWWSMQSAGWILGIMTSWRPKAGY